jgi:hypothetical protein
MVSPATTSATKKYEGNRCITCGKPLTHGEQGDTCKAHEGKLRQSADIGTAVPEGWIKMSEVCRKANDAGITTSALVNAAGGDAAVKPLLDPIFKVVYVGRNKFMNPAVITTGFQLLKAHQMEKAEKSVAPSTNDVAAISNTLHSVVKE